MVHKAAENHYIFSDGMFHDSVVGEKPFFSLHPSNLAWRYQRWANDTLAQANPRDEESAQRIFQLTVEHHKETP